MNSAYKEKSDKAFSLHQEGKLEEAEKLYKELLSQAPNDINVLNLYGMLCIAKKDYNKAIELLSAAVVLKSNAYVMTNLAKAYFMNKEINNSIKMYINALNISPSDDTFFSLGLAYKKANRLHDSEQAYKNALKLNPAHYSSLYNLALIYKDLKDNDNSLIFAKKALGYNRHDEDLYTLLSGLYEAKSDYKNAITALEAAISINNHNYVYFYNLGVLYSKVKNYKLSLDNYKYALLLNPNSIETHINMATIYKDNTKDLDKALMYLEHAYKINNSQANVNLMLSQIYREKFDNDKSIDILNKLLETEKNNPEIYNQLAINYMDIKEYNEALTNYNKALDLSPHNLNYLHGKSTALKYLDDYENSKKILEAIVSMPECSNQAKISLGMMYLKEKQFEKGMQLYSLRSEDTKFKEQFSDKVWSKDTDLNDKNILLYSDCGLGDTIMYARYIPLLEKISKNITLQTDNEVVSLLKNNYKDINVISKSDNRPEYDIVLPLMNIGWALSYDFFKIPFSGGYLTANEEKIKNFKLFDEFKTDKIKVGIFNQGNKKIYKNRSISINELEPLLSNTNATFYSFVDTNSNSIVSLSKYINDYSDSAALLKCIDLLVTIDSSIVHAAGALGVKTFLLLPHTAEWRWFNDDKTTPWYNSVKIFKQNKSDDWSDVINSVSDRITNYAN